MTRSAEAAIRHAEDLSRRAESASLDDSVVWADAVASARGARDALADEPGLEDLQRSAEATLADIERRREGCQSLVPGCLAASNRYRASTIVPPQVIDHDSQAAGALPDYSGISIMRRSIFFDLSGWKRLPPGTDPSIRRAARAGELHPGPGHRSEATRHRGQSPAHLPVPHRGL